jgi:hypothetical protein
MQYGPLKRWYPTTTLHGVITQKTLTWKSTVTLNTLAKRPQTGKNLLYHWIWPRGATCLPYFHYFARKTLPLVLILSACPCSHPSPVNFNQLADFHKTLCGNHGTKGHLMFEFYIFLTLITPTWRPCELLKWKRHSVGHWNLEWW